MKSHRAAADPLPVRADRVRRICCLGMLLGMVLSSRVWVSMSDRTFPLTPVWEGLGGWPEGISVALYGAALVLLAAMAAWPAGARGMRGVLAIWLALMLLLFLQDRMRWQPWAYQYVLCLVPFLFATQDERSLLVGARVVVVATYLWGGIHKLGSPFQRSFEGILAKDALANSDEFTHSLIVAFGRAIPYLEILLGVLLIVPKSRRFGVVFACLMHTGILLWKGPLGDGSNSVIWPWNVCMIAFVILLFPQGASLLPSGKAPRPAGLRATQGVITVLALVMPALSHAGLWPRYLSFHLYSGHQQRMLVALWPSGTAKLGESMKPFIRESAHWPGFAEIEGMRWAFNDLNVPLVSEDAVLLGVAKVLVDRHHLTDDDAFFYFDFPMRLEERGWRRHVPSGIPTLRRLGPAQPAPIPRA